MSISSEKIVDPNNKPVDISMLILANKVINHIAESIPDLKHRPIHRVPRLVREQQANQFVMQFADQQILNLRRDREAARVFDQLP